MIGPGEEFVYEFDALPFGCHLYHCHALPLKRHIHKGMYGAFIIDPDPARHPEQAGGRPFAPARHAREHGVAGVRHGDERLRHQLRRRERGLRRQHRGASLHASTRSASIAQQAGAHLSRQRRRVRPDQLVPSARQFLRLLRSRHDTHADAADRSTPSCSARPSAASSSSPTRTTRPAMYMFHAHQSEFAELGWMGMFDVVEATA